ncbi:MAG: ATP synthase F1 subunit delta [Melioribacteraceae bacterium]|jgi:F-type H+-transporting ATPase subunit delta|nr:ATP synthase F1 subunit delta [Melioribacteraceae bacterium]
MSVYRISYRYANSLFQLAVEKKIFDKVSQDVTLCFKTLIQSKELRAVLKSPVIKTTDKKSILTQVFKGKVSHDLLTFLEFVIDKGREDILFEILKEFLVLCDKKNGVVRARVSSAIELSENAKKEILSKFSVKTNKNIEADFIVNESLIGGFTININDTIYDASIKQQLRNLKKKFSEEVSISFN